MNGFAAGEQAWVTRLGSLRNAVRQELIGRQLDDHVNDHASVLDVGCGQGTQAIRLARRGCAVVGVDPSRDLLDRLELDAGNAGVHVETYLGPIGDLSAILGGRKFDIVCAHGLLMYLDDLGAALDALVERIAPGGMLSVTFRNGAALAFRPGMRRQWQNALDSFDSTTYINELGVHARAHRLEEMTSELSNQGLAVQAWYGVRVFTDPLDGGELVDEGEFTALVRAEFEAGRRDPYRQLASQIHLLAGPAVAARPVPR